MKHKYSTHRIENRKTDYFKRCRENFDLQRYIDKINEQTLSESQVGALVKAKKRNIRYLYETSNTFACNICSHQKNCRFHKILKKGNKSRSLIERAEKLGGAKLH